MLFIYNIMTSPAYWNRIETMCVVISVVMVIMLCGFFVTYFTNERFCRFHFSGFDSMINGSASLIFFWIFISHFFTNFISLQFSARALAVFFLIEFIFLNVLFTIYLMKFSNFIFVFLKALAISYRDFFSVIVCIFFYAVNNTNPILFIIFSQVFFSTFFTSIAVSVFPAFVSIKIIDRFINIAHITSFIHGNLLTKMPLASWDKHETKGRVDFNTLCACLSQPHFIKGIIS
jgi:hypothetical protein